MRHLPILPFQARALISAWEAAMDGVVLRALVTPFPRSLVNPKNRVLAPDWHDASNYEWNPPTDTWTCLAEASPPWRGAVPCSEPLRFCSPAPGVLMAVFDDGAWLMRLDGGPAMVVSHDGKYQTAEAMQPGQHRLAVRMINATPSRLSTVDEAEAGALGLDPVQAVEAYRKGWGRWGLRSTDDPWTWRFEAWPTACHGSRLR